MAMSKESQTRNLIAALDIGTSKTVVLIGEIKLDGLLEVIGVGMHESAGTQRGMVFNIEEAANAIRHALYDAELMADCKISEVYTGIPGSYIQSSYANSIVKITDRYVSQTDIEHVLETASSLDLSCYRYVLHMLEQEFSIDGQDGIKKPLGMCGLKLKAKVHIVTSAVIAKTNLTKCIHSCGLKVSEIIFQPLAFSKAVLVDIEKYSGVCMIDIGGGITNVVIFTNGAIRHTAIVPMAGEQITSDIAMALRTTHKDAEDIKIKYGCALRQLADDAPVEVRGIGMFTRRTLAEVIEPRVKELYMLVREEVRHYDWNDLMKFSIVITGGGSSMPYMVELGEEIFHMPVRLGLPGYVGGLANLVITPQFSTSIGLLLHGRDRTNHE